MTIFRPKSRKRILHAFHCFRHWRRIWLASLYIHRRCVCTAVPIHINAEGIIFHKIVGLVQCSFHKFGRSVDKVYEFRRSQYQLLLLLGQVYRRSRVLANCSRLSWLSLITRMLLCFFHFCTFPLFFKLCLSLLLEQLDLLHDLFSDFLFCLLRCIE